MNLSEIVKLECCDIDFNAKDKDEALLKLASILKKNDELKDVTTEEIYDLLKEREDMGSTGFGKGIAIPHSRIKGLKKFIIGIAVSSKGVNFESLDKKRSKIFITIVGPPEDRSGHLKLLAKVSLILKENRVVENLLKAKSKIGLYEEFLLRFINIIPTAILVIRGDNLRLMEIDVVMKSIPSVMILISFLFLFLATL